MTSQGGSQAGLPFPLPIRTQRPLGGGEDTLPFRSCSLFRVWRGLENIPRTASVVCRDELCRQAWHSPPLCCLRLWDHAACCQQSLQGPRRPPLRGAGEQRPARPCAAPRCPLTGKTQAWGSACPEATWRTCGKTPREGSGAEALPVLWTSRAHLTPGGRALWQEAARPPGGAC